MTSFLKNFTVSVLKELQSIHICVPKMKQLARLFVYNRNIDHEIEYLVKISEDCAKLRKNPPKGIIHPWDDPQADWESVYIDYSGQIIAYYF